VWRSIASTLPHVPREAGSPSFLKKLKEALWRARKKPPLSRGFIEEAHTGFEPVPPP
jgi:hypothetical protein